MAFAIDKIREQTAIMLREARQMRASCDKIARECLYLRELLRRQRVKLTIQRAALLANTPK